MYVALIALTLFALTGCGKTLDQVKQTAHSVVDIGFKVYEDLKDNVDTAKELVTPASPATPEKP